MARWSQFAMANRLRSDWPSSRTVERLIRRYAMGRAKSVAEFKEAMRPCNLPMFNAMVADTVGNIFYVYNGAVPKRSTKFDWTKPVDGSNPETDWQGYLRFEELPQVREPQVRLPAKLQSITAFDNAGGQELRPGEVDENPKASQFPPYLMATERERTTPGLRSRAASFIPSANSHYEDWTRDGFDTKILEAELRIPDLVKEWEVMSKVQPDRAAKVKEAVDLLKSWDCISAVDSIAMTLFAEAYDRVLKMAAKRDLKDYPRFERWKRRSTTYVQTRGTWKVAWGEINRLQRIHGSQIDMRGQGGFRDDQPSWPSRCAGSLGVVFNFYAMPQPGQ